MRRSDRPFLTRPLGRTRYRITRTFTVPAVAVLGTLVLLQIPWIRAQSPPPTEVADSFRRLDTNGDGTLDAAEAGTLGFFKPADSDGDGRVTEEEVRIFAAKPGSAPAPGSRRTAGMEGDGAAPVFHWPVAPVRIPVAECPIEVIEATAADGRAVRAWWRKPRGDGPFPAILFIHGGLTEFPETNLRQHLTDNPVLTRFLEAGYAVVMATFRTYEQDVQSRGPIEDVRAVLRRSATLAGVDPRRIALYGGSGGGSIALELGGDPEVRAIVAGEPATVLYTGMLTTGEYGPRLGMMADPEKFFTPELRARTLAKLKTIRTPVLILHGDRHDLHKLNKPLFLPLMKEAGVKVEYREFPGYGHGFYFGGGGDRWGKGADEQVVADVIGKVRLFLDREMPPAPVAVDAGNAPGWVTKAVSAPNVTYHTFTSAAAKSEVSFHVYTPPVDEKEKDRRFPVLYWLHGTGGGLAGIAPVSAWFDAAIRDGKIPPMLVVFPNGLPASLWCDSSDGARPVETVLIRELIPLVDRTFRTLETREGRIIEGFSMGGYGAARLGFRYPELFTAVSILAGGPLDLDFAGPRATGNPAERERILDQTFGGDLDRYRAVHPITVAEQQADAVRGRMRVRVAVGSGDFSEPLNRAYSAHLRNAKIDHTFTVVPGVDHDTLALLRGLGEANWAFYPFPAAAAAPAVPASGTHERTFSHAGLDRVYRLRIPPGYDGSKPVPLLFAFHGGEGSAAVAEAGLGFNPLADQHGFIVVYPQGTSNPGRGFGWNDGRVSPRFPGRETVDDTGFIRALITALKTELKVDEHRIFAAGNSNGGFMTQRLGWELADLLAAIAPGAGTLGTALETEFKPQHPVHVLYLHGTADPAVPFEGGEVIGRGGIAVSAPRMVELWVEANGCVTPPKIETLPKTTSDPTRVIRETYAPGPKGAEVIFYRIEGHGHNWPGRVSRGVNPQAGPSTGELNAAEVAWAFFATHPKGIPVPER